MKVLMIGGTGCLSSAVVAEALRKGLEVTIITRGHRRVPDGVVSIKADCYDYESIEKLISGRMFDAVVDYLCYTDEQIKNSFELYSKHTGQYMFISSCAVYNTADCKKCHEDSPKVLPIWDYSVNKWKSEELLARLALQSSCAYTVVRPCVTYGDTRIPYGIGPAYGRQWTLVARILNGKPIIRWNEGRNRCNMMHVDDFAVGLVGLIGNPAAYNEPFNICGDEIPTFNDVLSAVSEAIGHPVKTIDMDSEFYASELSWRKGELLGGRCIDAIIDNSKIKRVVPAFRQNILLKDGVKRTIAAIQAQGYQDGIDWLFEAQTDRAIRRWCKLNSLPMEDMNLKFIDYLHAATLADRWSYLSDVYPYNWGVRLINRFGRIFH